jgi:hypothetical protein
MGKIKMDFQNKSSVEAYIFIGKDQEGCAGRARKRTSKRKGRSCP